MIYWDLDTTFDLIISLFIYYIVFTTLHCFRSCTRLRSLEQAGAAWQQFESHLTTLQVALRGDQEALRLLHVALQEGQVVSPDIASSLRDIAKLLSEKQDNDPNSLTTIQVKIHLCHIV